MKFFHSDPVALLKKYLVITVVYCLEYSPTLLLCDYLIRYSENKQLDIFPRITVSVTPSLAALLCFYQ